MGKDSFGLGEYDWTTAAQPGEIPLMIASRVLDRTRSLIAGADSVVNCVAEADIYNHNDTASEFEARSLVVGRGTTYCLTMVEDSDGGLELQACKNGRQYTIAVDAMFSGPLSLPVVDFSRMGRGKSYGYTMDCEREHRRQNLEMCWQIASVASVALSDFGFRLETGYWPEAKTA
jgi:hypothetical protein